MSEQTAYWNHSALRAELDRTKAELAKVTAERDRLRAALTATQLVIHRVMGGHEDWLTRLPLWRDTLNDNQNRLLDVGLLIDAALSAPTEPKPEEAELAKANETIAERNKPLQ